MTRFVLGIRFAALGAAVFLAFPLSGDVFEVRGGVDPCDTLALGTTDCVAKTGLSCQGEKDQCRGCNPAIRELMQSLCDENGTAACPGTGCVAGQKNSKLSGTSCIAQFCPGSSGG